MHVSVRGGCCRLEVTICFWFHHCVPRGPDFRSLKFTENIKRLPPWICLRISKTTNMFTFDQRPGFCLFRLYSPHAPDIAYWPFIASHWIWILTVRLELQPNLCFQTSVAILTFWKFVEVFYLSLSLLYCLTTQFSRFWCTRRGWCSPWSTSSLGLAELSGEMFYISGDS